MSAPEPHSSHLNDTDMVVWGHLQSMKSGNSNLHVNDHAEKLNKSYACDDREKYLCTALECLQECRVSQSALLGLTLESYA